MSWSFVVLPFVFYLPFSSLYSVFLFLFVWGGICLFLNIWKDTWVSNYWNFLALHFGELQTFKGLQMSEDTTRMWAEARLMFLLRYKPIVSASWNTYFSSSRVLWSRARRGFPVRSSSCNFGGRFSGKVISLSSLQLKSTHWRNKWKQGEG